jgi:hypothetical protein
MSNYVSIAEFRAFKGRDGTAIPVSSFSDSEIQAALNQTEEIFERVTQNRFGAFSEVWQIDGARDNTLTFPPAIMYPLLSITKVEELEWNDGVISTAYDLVENEDYTNCHHYLSPIPTGPHSRRRRIVALGGYVFVPGQRNYQVTGVWGMLTTPLEIKRAICLYAFELLLPGQSGMAPAGVGSYSIGDFSISFMNNSRLAKGNSLTGFLEIDRILSRYVSMASLFLNGPETATRVSGGTITPLDSVVYSAAEVDAILNGKLNIAAGMRLKIDSEGNSTVEAI